jgi:hypothetical protein
MGAALHISYTTRLVEVVELAGQKVNPLDYSSYAYPLYAAGILTFLVLLLAVRSQHQYAPKPAE